MLYMELFMFYIEQNRKNLGKIGENIAERFFISRGYSVQLNQRFGSLEIDLIASRSGQVRFIEVKTLSKNINGYPEVNRISKRKIKRLRRAVLKYSLILAINEDIIHVDAMIIFCDFKKKLANIKYYLDIVA